MSWLVQIQEGMLAGGFAEKEDVAMGTPARHIFPISITAQLRF